MIEKNIEQSNQNMIYTIEEAFTSKLYEPYMSAVYTVYQNGKKSGFDMFSTQCIVRSLYSIFDKDIRAIELPLRDLYYLTKDSNPKCYFVRDLIRPDIYNTFDSYFLKPLSTKKIDGLLPGHSFKIMCKIISNFLMDEEETLLLKFIDNDLRLLTNIFDEYKDDAQKINLRDKVNPEGYICQGCLRIFSALCNRQEIIQKINPQLIAFSCINPFIYSLKNFQNQYMIRTTIMYTYYIVNWSPPEVLSFLFQKDAIDRLILLVDHHDKKKNYISFYSTLILKAFSKLHDPKYANDLLANYQLFDKNIASLSVNTRGPYLSFLFHIAIIDQSYAENFVQSIFIKSIIDTNPSDIKSALQSNYIKPSIFIKYMASLFFRFPSTRNDIILLFKSDNIIYLFVLSLPSQNDAAIYNVTGCIDFILNSINTNSEYGPMFSQQLNDKSDDIIEELQSFVDDQSGMSQQSYDCSTCILQKIKSILNIC